MNELYGQGEEWTRTLRRARAHRLHHGVLITGARGVGKTTAANRLAAALLCVGPDPDGPCGTCASCRRFAVHPDLHRVEIPEDKDEIPVDLVRDLRDSLQRLPVAGSARVVVIDPADRVNVQGQNALLKTLEEPGRATWLLLPTTRREALLDTVRSRIAELRVLPLADERLRQELSRTRPGHAAAARDWAATHAGGSLGLAQHLLDREIRPIFDRLEAFLQGAGTPVAVARAALDGVSGRIDTLERARDVLLCFRTILRKELWRTLASDRAGPYLAATSVPWIVHIERLLDVENDLFQRIPPEQVLTAAFLPLRTRRAEAHR